MADGHRIYPVDILVLHHAVSDPMNNWEDIDVQDWFSNIGKSRGYQNGAINPMHYHPSRPGQLTYSMAHFCLHPYTKDGNKYGWRLTQLIEDVWNNVAWHAGNWPINQRSIGIECAGNWLEKKLPQDACMLIADTFRQHDINIGGRFQITGHRQWSATQCPGMILDNRGEIIDMINNPQNYSHLFEKPVEVPQGGIGSPVIDEPQTNPQMEQEINTLKQQVEQQNQAILSLTSLKQADDTTIQTLKTENSKLSTDLQTALATIKDQESKINDLTQKLETATKKIEEQNVTIAGLEKAITEYKTGKESDTYLMTHEAAQKLEKILVSKESWKSKLSHIGKEVLLVLINWGVPTVAVLLAMLEGWIRGLNETTVIGGFTLGAGAAIVKVLCQTLTSKGTVLVKAKADEEKAKLESELKAVQ